MAKLIEEMLKKEEKLDIVNDFLNRIPLAQGTGEGWKWELINLKFSAKLENN